MSLINRTSTPALVQASRANSQRSTGPRSAAGKAAARSNGRKRCKLSPVEEGGLIELGENPSDFIQHRDALMAGMKPRDEWETAWAEDIAMLRWRLDRLQRAETATLALQRRKFATELQRRKMPPTGMDGLKLTTMLKTVGFCGVADSAMKFESVVEYLSSLHHFIAAEDDSGSVLDAFGIVYGEAPPVHAAFFRASLVNLVAAWQEGRHKEVANKRMDAIRWVTREIENYEALQAAYLAEQVCGDSLRQNAELMIASDRLDEFIRYEAHLERQIERRIKQFYVRRREQTIADPKSTSAEPQSNEIRTASRKSFRPASRPTLVEATAAEPRRSEKRATASAEKEAKKFHRKIRQEEVQLEPPAPTSTKTAPQPPPADLTAIATGGVNPQEKTKPSGYSKQTTTPEHFSEPKPSGLTN